jgi:hypothetical protein
MDTSIKKNVGRPPKEVPPDGDVTLTMRVPAKLKSKILSGSRAYGMTMTEFITMLVERSDA